MGGLPVPIREITLAEAEKYQTSPIQIDGSKLRKGEIKNPKLVISYENVDGVSFQTVYKINLEERAGQLYNVESFIDPKFLQITNS